jgi:Probable N6-adenine methyltransferase
MFASGFVERRDLEQYFWDGDTVRRLMTALEYTSEFCCLATPSLAYALHTVGQDIALLGIDRCFAYLPGFRYWYILCPRPVDDMPSPLRRI